MKRIKFGKCPHYRKCKLYAKDNKICNEEGGFYGSKEAGCSRELTNEDLSSKLRK